MTKLNGTSARQAAPDRLTSQLQHMFQEIYPDHDAEAMASRAIETFWHGGSHPRMRARAPSNLLWSEHDCIVITYGNSITDARHKPLDVLSSFLEEQLGGVIRGVHILPFFPYTSDDGFAVTDYTAVNSQLGDWPDIERIAGSFKLMSDLVLNHISSHSSWFSAYRQGHAPYDRYFVEASEADDLSKVVRPRAHALLRKVETANGERHVWCTFSHDQIDLDFSNPEVLFEFLKIMRLHIDKGIRIIRLDAVAFIWKEIGTTCIHHEKAHAIVRLMRLLMDFAQEPIVLLTETNVPNRENLSYFGNRNEAHAIYNFSLPPLLLHALLTGNSRYLTAWQSAMPPAPLGCTYLNFLASHDGIGVRPVEGLLPPEELDLIIDAIKRTGGLISERATPDGGVAPYELNISLADALKGTVKGEDQWHFQRFVCSQTVMMSLEGIPAFYIHSLLASPSDREGVERTNHNRAINRRKWDYDELKSCLADPATIHARVLDALKKQIAIRTRQPAFHPNATQFTLRLGDAVFGVWRQSLDRAQSIFAIANLRAEPTTVPTTAINLIEGYDWLDLLCGEKIDAQSCDITFAPYQCRWITNLPA